MKITPQKFFGFISAAGGISSTAVLGSTTNIIESSSLMSSLATSITKWILTLLGTIIYFICKFVMMFIDLIQLIVYKFLGITTDIDDYVVYDKTNPIIRFITNDTVLTVLKAAFTIAIVLVIVFTIFSIIVSEYRKAAMDVDYNIKRVWGRAFKSIFGMVVFPGAFIAIILLINAILAGFSSILSAGSTYSLSNQIFITCSYDANVYRNYAKNNMRIPIYINFDDPYDSGVYTRYSASELASIYREFQSDGIDIYNNFANSSFPTFSEAVSYSYKNNSIINNRKTFSTYENFVVTAEQYYVMADFVDYALLHNITYYYKPITDQDIEWKYVSNAIFNEDEGSLTITYKDASNLNGGNDYTICYQPNSYEVSTPIEDAVSTLMTLLSIDGSTTYNALEYVDGTINDVQWVADKVSLGLSSGYTSAETWTIGDQILLYEYYSREYNNTLRDYSISELKNGITLDSYTLNVQYYRSYSSSYITLVSYHVVPINGSYYLLEGSGQKDDYGDEIYQIAGSNAKGTILLRKSSEDEDSKVYFPDVDVDENKKGTYYSAIADDANVLDQYKANTKGNRYTIENEDGTIEYAYGFMDANGIYHQVDRVQLQRDEKEVGWATKFVSDLEAIYRNINLQQLITTGEWLEVFNNGSGIISNGDTYTSSFDTSLITPQGLVFSELFLSLVSESDGSNLGNYMFESSYDQTQLRALMLSLMGEENYNTLSTTMDKFVELFNMLFEPLIEKIVDGEGQEFLSGSVSSLQTYTYKAYLASLLLSSDCADFLTDIARQIVEIYQFSYAIIGSTDENTNNSQYLSFAELVRQENENGNVVFTFEFDVKATDANIYAEAQSLFENDVKKGYSDCRLISLYIKVKSDMESQGVTEDDADWPVYMTYFKQYILGTMSRLDIVLSQNVSTSNIAGILSEYNSYTSRLQKAKNQILTMTDQKNIGEVVCESVTKYIEDYYADSTKDKYASIIDYSEDSWLDILFCDSEKDFDEYVNNYTNYTTVVSKIADQLDIIIKYYSEAKAKETDDATKQTLSTIISAMKTTKNYWQYYITSQNIMDSFHKYYITYAVRMANTEKIAQTFTVVINNHSYTMTITMPTAQIAEYVFGGVYLNSLGYETVFVDSSYTGFLDINYATDGSIAPPQNKEANFDTINNFMQEIAQVTVESYYLTNLFLVTDSNAQNTQLRNLYYYKSAEGDTYKVVNGEEGSSAIVYPKLFLLNILDSGYFDEELIVANMINTTYLQNRGIEFTNLYKYVTNQSSSQYSTEQFNEDVRRYIEALSNDETISIFNQVASYLLGGNDDYSTYSTKEFRLELLAVVADYIEDGTKTQEENQTKYLTIFNLACSDFMETDTGMTDTSGNSIISVKYIKDTQTKSLILKLAGLEDKPEEELIGLEYSTIFNDSGYDENNGDYFIICTFDSETNMYIPFLMSSQDSTEGYVKAQAIVDGTRTQQTWLEKYDYGIATTSYYASVDGKASVYPVIARGIITSDGYPTAIRQVDGVTEFYRSNITIRNASDIGVQMYYMNLESVSVNYNLFSSMVNSIVKSVSGKSLVEHAYESIPRFAINTNLNLPMGVDTQVTTLSSEAIELDYTFFNVGGLSSENFYSLLKINFLVLLIALLALTPIMVKALYGVLGRVVDITLYYCMSPIAMSTIALGRDVGKLGDAKDGPKEEKPIFSSWYRELTRKTLSVFGYVIAFQIFFILVPFLTNIEFLPDTSAIASLPLFSYIDISFINMFIKMIFIICSAYLINSAPELLSDILGTSNGIDDGANVKANIKSTLNEVKASLSGKMFVNAFNYAKTQALDSGVIGGMKNLTGDVKKIGAKIISRVMYRKARINGVAKDVAKQASRQFYEATKYEVDMRRARREERIAEANSAYGSQIGSKPIQKEGDANLKKLRGKKGKIQKIKDRFKPFRP